jgi:hypothetical protein
MVDLSSCAAPDQSGVQLGQPVTGTVLEGTVQRDGSPVPGAYVRLLDGSGEFTAEVVSGSDGQFRFHAAPGTWTVRALARGAQGTSTVQADPGSNRVEVALAAG